MEAKGYTSFREAKLHIDSLDLDSLNNKTYLNPIENIKFTVIDHRIKEYGDKYYIIISLVKIDVQKGEHPFFEVDYDLFREVLVPV